MKIIKFMDEREGCTVSELSRYLRLNGHFAIKHLKALEIAGIVTSKRTAGHRRLYFLNRDNVLNVRKFIYRLLSHKPY